MKESTTYQAILREGRQEGRQEGLTAGLIAARREDLLDLLRERFGPVPPEVEERVMTCDDPARLKTALRHAVTMPALADLQL